MSIKGVNKATNFPFYLVSNYSDSRHLRKSHIFTQSESVAVRLANEGLSPTTIRTNKTNILDTLEDMSMTEFLHALCSIVYDIDKTSAENQVMTGKFTILV